MFCLFLSAPSGANSAEFPFEEAFLSQVELRSLKIQLEVISQEGSGNEFTLKEKTKATQAKFSVAEVQATKLLSLGKFNTWEQEILRCAYPGKKLPGADPAKSKVEVQTYLSSAFPNAKQFSPLAWKTIGDCLGKANQESFFFSIFPAKELVVSGPPSPNPKLGLSILWIENPYQRFLSKNEREKSLLEKARSRKALSTAGFAVTTMELSPFPHLDDQAEELRQKLNTLLASRKVLLITQGESSAILRRCFDLNPELLQRSSILGWLNVNGLFFGAAPETIARAPASLTEKTATAPAAQAKLELLKLQNEINMAPAPFGGKFPLLNLLSLESNSISDSVDPAGTTFYLRKGNAIEKIPDLLMEISLPDRN